MSGTVVLTGGVGGAKLVQGLLAAIDPSDVTVVVNTGDDFRHFGLHVSPDIDTLLYTLSGRANLQQGWGRADETWSFMAALRDLGGEDWFNLGDMDVALHVLRTAALAEGRTLSDFTAALAARWGIGARVLPMSDDPVATRIDTASGELEFQRYFVEQRCEPAVRAVRFEGAESARPAPGVVEAIANASRVLIAPSNPWLSIDPLLAIPGLRGALEATPAPVVAISPLIGGRAVKGPTSKLMAELGLGSGNEAIAAHYAGLIDGLVIDTADQCVSGVDALTRTDTLMKSLGDKIRVAEAALALAATLQ